MSFNIIDSKNSLTQLFNSIQRSPGEISIIENFLYPIESWPENLESWAQIEHQNQKLIFKDLNQFKQIESIKIEQETKNDILALNLSEYLILYKNNPDFYQKLRCSEGLLPSSFAEKLKDRIVDSDFINSINDQYSKEYYYRFFLARENSITETHLDWVSHTNLLFQIFGRKRVFIFRPELCLHLPMTNNLVNLKLENVLSVARKMDMICGEIVLERGQGVVIPPYHLHAVLYEENAASLALRVLPLKKIGRWHNKIPVNPVTVLMFWKQHLEPQKSIVDPFINCSLYEDYWEIVKNSSNKFDLTYEEINFDQAVERKIFNRYFDPTYQVGLKIKRDEIMRRGCSQFER